MASQSTTSTKTRHEPNLYRPAVHGYLPNELIEALNQAYWLHMLAVDPDQVLPPGKSILSMMTRTEARRNEAKTDVHRTVEGILHKAFWDEAIQSLSSPLPSVQLTRLKLLYFDLSTALSPLLPPKHAVLISLSSPIPPTSSPLQSCIIFLKEILMALKERCAPVRDDEILDLLNKLDEPIPPVPQPKTMQPIPEDTTIVPSPIAERVIEVIKSIMALAEHMKSDLEQFTFGTMSESQLKVIIVQQAKVRERELVLELWKNGEGKGEAAVRGIWQQWVEDTLEAHIQDFVSDRKGRWLLRLVQALGSTIPISCNIPGSTNDSSAMASLPPPASATPQSNNLPPQFLFSSPSLFYVQNFLQALVIAAALRSLTRLPPATAAASGGDFMQRVWTLLRSEIDEPDNGLSATKLINLEDEVVRARTLVSVKPADSISSHGLDPPSTTQSIPPLDNQEEIRLRSAVQRTLQPQDPVFVLLQKRLLVSMAKHLLDRVTQSADRHTQPQDGTGSGGSSGRGAPYPPSRLQTGRVRQLSPGGGSERPGKRFRLASSTASELLGSISEHRRVETVKGFEDPVLAQAIEEAFSKVLRCVRWVENTWHDLM